VSLLPNDSDCSQVPNSLVEEVFMLIPGTTSINFPILITNHTFDAHLSASGKILTKASALELLASLENADKYNSILIQAPLLALFFYLIQQPLSIPFMEEWFIESGLNEQAAHALSEFIFWSRLDRDDEEMEQLVNGLAMLRELPTLQQRPEYITPSDITHAFRLAFVPDTIRLYGSFDPFDNRLNATHKILQLELLNETNYLIEDEAHLLLGLSLPLFTVMVAASGPLPTLNEWLKQHTSIAERTHRSLGYMTEYFYSECFEALNKDVALVNLVSYNQESGFFQQPLHRNWNNSADSGDRFSGLPLFLLLNKPQFTN